jgi:curved DNA-binding protein CbpA
MDSSPRLSDEELRLFLDRIARRIAERPPEVDPPAHRERVAGLLRQSGEASFYQILGVAPTATAQEVHGAYERVGGLVHPAQAPHLGLEGREGVLEVLFESVTRAYLTLCEPDRRKRYDRDLGVEARAAAWARVAPAVPRRDEAREVARGYFDRARDLAHAQDYHSAIELLREAARTDPRPEYLALLGKLQARNPRWLRASAENLESALKLGCQDPELGPALAQVRERIQAGEAVNPAPTANDDEIDVPLPQPQRRSGRGAR